MCRLALALGKTLRELSESLSPSELAVWRAYYRLEPWGDHLHHAQAAELNWMLWSLFRDDDAPDRTLKDFLPYG